MGTASSPSIVPRILLAAWTSSRARSPCVTTNAPITLSPSSLREIPVDRAHAVPRARQVLAQSLGHRYGAVPPARASDGQSHVGLSFLDEFRHQVVHQRVDLVIVLVVLAGGIEEVDH